MCDERAHHGERVRYTVREVDLIIFIEISVLKRETLARVTVSNSFQPRPSVLYLFTAAEPANSFLFIESFRPNHRLHPILVQTVGLREIKHVEPHCLFQVVAPVVRVSAEIEPLLMCPAVRVEAHNQVILIVPV